MQLPLIAAISPALEERPGSAVRLASGDFAPPQSPPFQNVFSNQVPAQTAGVGGVLQAPIMAAESVEDLAVFEAGGDLMGPICATAIILPPQVCAPRNAVQAEGGASREHSVRFESPSAMPVVAISGEAVSMASAPVTKAKEPAAEVVPTERVEQTGARRIVPPDMSPASAKHPGHLAAYTAGPAQVRPTEGAEASTAGTTLQAPVKSERHSMVPEVQGGALPESDRQPAPRPGISSSAAEPKGAGGTAAEADVVRERVDVTAAHRLPPQTAPTTPTQHQPSAKIDTAEMDAPTEDPPRQVVPPSTKHDPVPGRDGALPRAGREESPPPGAPLEVPARIALGGKGAFADAPRIEATAREAGTPPRGSHVPQGAASSAVPAPFEPARIETAPPLERTADPAPLSSDGAERDGPFADVPASEPRAAAGALPASHSPAPVHRPDLARGMAVQVAEVISQAHDRAIELKLHPEELGRVSMTLSQDGGSLTVALTAERGETLDLMRRHIDLLSEELRRLGYGSVDFTFGDGGAGEGALQRGAEASGPFADPHEAPASDDAPPRQVPAAPAAPGSGHVDIRL